MPTAVAIKRKPRGLAALFKVQNVRHVIQIAFNLPADVTPDKAIKDLESATFSVTNLRTWLSARQAK